MKLIIDHADLGRQEMVDYLNEVATDVKEGKGDGMGWHLLPEVDDK